MMVYNEVEVGTGALADALKNRDMNGAKKIYKETTDRAKALYGEDDYRWFTDCARRYRTMATSITTKEPV